MVMAAQTRLNNAAQVAADTKAAGTKETAIAAVAADDDDGLGGSDAPNTTTGAVGEYTLSIKHGETSITVEGATNDDDVKFTQAMDLGGGRTMHTRTMDADEDGNVVTEVAIVATDIEAPKPVAFAMWEDEDETTPQMLDARDLDADEDADGDGNDGNDWTALGVTTANIGNVMSSAFSAGTEAVLTFTNDDTATDDMDEAFETAGTYNGSMGTYRCNGTGECTVSVDADGMITAMSPGWIFTPGEDVTTDQPDYDYLHYGVWLMKTADSDGATTYNDVETFAGSSIDASGSVASVTGSATYNGGATGVYVHSVTNDDGTRASATSGQFSAAASLTAYFDQTVDDPWYCQRQRSRSDRTETAEHRLRDHRRLRPGK